MLWASAFDIIPVNIPVTFTTDLWETDIFVSAMKMASKRGKALSLSTPGPPEAAPEYKESGQGLLSASNYPLAVVLVAIIFLVAYLSTYSLASSPDQSTSTPDPVSAGSPLDLATPAKALSTPSNSGLLPSKIGSAAVDLTRLTPASYPSVASRSAAASRPPPRRSPPPKALPKLRASSSPLPSPPPRRRAPSKPAELNAGSLPSPGDTIKGPTMPLTTWPPASAMPPVGLDIASRWLKNLSAVPSSTGSSRTSTSASLSHSHAAAGGSSTARRSGFHVEGHSGSRTTDSLDVEHEKKIHQSDTAVEATLGTPRTRPGLNVPKLMPGQICTTEDINCRRRECEALKGAKNKASIWPGLDKLGFPIRFFPKLQYWDLIYDATTYKGKGIPKSELVPSAKEALKKMSWDSCAIVGNGGGLKFSKYGQDIDGHDVVIRMNQAPTIGYEEYVGSKTTIRLLNRLWSVNYALRYKFNMYKLQLEPGVSLISSRGEDLAQNYLRLTKAMKALKRDTSVYVLNYKTVAYTRQALAAYRNCLGAAGFSKFEGGGVPSSGLVAIMALKEVCRKVNVYGFGQPVNKQGKKADYQYYVWYGTERPVGNALSHSFDAEFRLVKALAREGFISLCGPTGCLSGENVVR